MSQAYSIGFLGAGRMATALALGFVRAGLVQSGELVASDVEAVARDAFSKATGGASTDSNRTVSAARTVLIAVKPHQVGEVLRELREVITPQHLVISIAAGLTLAQLQSHLAEGTRVVRVMPNTPAVVGASATAYALGSACRPEDAAWVGKLFASVGVAFHVREALLDAVTGLSGSGPAYGYLMIEALSDGGVAAGLPRETATRLAAQTLLGAARMVLETGLHPGALKDQVTSPGGTTIEGLHELERAGVRAGLMNAVRAASDKSRRLAQSAS
jgi:pyrroline-5-carboxylate reductase